MATALIMAEPRAVETPQPISLPRAIASALVAGEYVVGRGACWTPRAALAGLSEMDIARLPALIAKAQLDMHCDEEWLVNRLTVLWLAAGYRKGEALATAWLGETVRLLAHVPTDILAAAIDQAWMNSERGFLPAVGEILKLAEPALDRRRRGLRRMEIIGQAAKGSAEPVSEPEPTCTPEQAAQIMREEGVVVRTATNPVVPTAKPEPTVADYVALGLTEQEAKDAIAERERLLRRCRAKPIGEVVENQRAA